MGAPIMILDELDSGVGGRLGQPVAAMLRRMAAPVASAAGGPGTATQILCVSHIPQVRAVRLNMLSVRNVLSMCDIFMGSHNRCIQLSRPMHCCLKPSTRSGVSEMGRSWQ